MHLACQTWRRGFPQELEEQPGRIDVRCRVPDAGRRDRDIASAHDVFAKPTRKSPARMARMIASRSRDASTSIHERPKCGGRCASSVAIFTSGITAVSYKGRYMPVAVTS